MLSYTSCLLTYLAMVMQVERLRPETKKPINDSELMLWIDCMHAKQKRKRKKTRTPVFYLVHLTQSKATSKEESPSDNVLPQSLPRTRLTNIISQSHRHQQSQLYTRNQEKKRYTVSTGKHKEERKQNCTGNQLTLEKTKKWPFSFSCALYIMQFTRVGSTTSDTSTLHSM